MSSTGRTALAVTLGPARAYRPYWPHPLKQSACGRAALTPFDQEDPASGPTTDRLRQRTDGDPGVRLHRTVRHRRRQDTHPARRGTHTSDGAYVRLPRQLLDAAADLTVSTRVR
ncbi:hypothetical protein [Streptomyces sp. SAS_276]|uniref:hypothetical protein n=1 Tax=Streptomyces sp. SAS_276 TaxID=3412745 RepID=UPI00403C66F8